MELRPTYLAIMLAAIATGLLLSRRRQHQLPLAPLQRAGILFAAFVGAMLGAKLPFVLSDWDGLVSGSAWFANGKTILWGLVGGYLVVELAKWFLGVQTKTGDAFVVPVAAAVAVGRLGCFVAGCCYGTPTALPWGARFADGVPRHPTQLYECAFHTAAALVFLWMERRGLFPQQRFKLYILSYVVYRFLTEFIRPEPRYELGLTAYQWASLVVFLLFVYLWRRDARRLPAPAATPEATAEPV